MYKNTCYEVQRHLTCGATKSRKQEAVLNDTTLPGIRIMYT